MDAGLDRLLDEAIERELVEHGQLLPLWLKHPTIPCGSVGWRMGDGEWYRLVFGRWFDRLSAEARVRYFAQHLPLPLEWADHVAWSLRPDEEDPPIDRLFELGWVDEAEWEAWVGLAPDQR